MDLESDDSLVPGAPGGGCCILRSASLQGSRYLEHLRLTECGASTWTPIGRPPDDLPNGTLMAGCPARFEATVKRSDRYIVSGSPVFAPSSKAVVGVVAPNSTSTRYAGLEGPDDDGSHFLGLPVVRVVVAG